MHNKDHGNGARLRISRIHPFFIRIVSNERRFFVFITCYLVFSFKMSQHGFLSWASRGFSFTNWGVTGAPGWFHNSGEVGIQMCIYIPIAIAFIIGVYKYVSKTMLAILFFMPVSGIGTAIASSSRGALIGLVAASSWSIMRKPKIFIIGGFVLALTLFIVINSIPKEFMVRFENTGSDNTSLERLERWKHGASTLRDFPIIGVGFEAWETYYPKHFTFEYDGTLLVHNIFIQCGAELGWSGLLVFIAMICSCFMTTRRVRKLGRGYNDQFLCTLSYGFDSALIGLLVSASFVTVLYYPY
ncbi:O-antigen ligase family protein, partial [Desulfobacterales bacterium HSG17]|nr:O-antigen ligase family protein [Desulfobacterales bacterium HSG17]